MSGEITVGIDDIRESLNEIKAGIEGLQDEINHLERRGITTLQVPSSVLMPWFENETGDSPSVPTSEVQPPDEGKESSKADDLKGIVVDPAPTVGTPTPIGGDPQWQADRACKLRVLSGYDASSIALFLECVSSGLKDANAKKNVTQ